MCNPPFGKQLATPEAIVPLYRQSVRELDRVLRPGGKCVLIVSDAKALRAAVERVGWKEERHVYEADRDEYDSWSIEQIEEVLRVFRHASERGEWIVSAGEVFSHDANYGARGPGSPPYPARAPCPDTEARVPCGGNRRIISGT